MQLDIVAPLVLLTMAVVVVVSTQLVAPARARRSLTRRLAAAGWEAVAPESQAGWTEVMSLAVEEARGAQRNTSHDERFGALSVHYERSERRSGRTRALYRRPGTRRPLYVAEGVRSTCTETRSGRLLPSRRRRSTDARELWIGQEMNWDVAAPELVYSALSERFGDAFRDLAAKRGVDPDQVPGLRSPTADNPSLALREALQRTDTAEQALASVFVGPRAWVMTVPLGRGAGRLEALLELADELSAVADAVA